MKLRTENPFSIDILEEKIIYLLFFGYKLRKGLQRMDTKVSMLIVGGVEVFLQYTCPKFFQCYSKRFVHPLQNLQ